MISTIPRDEWSCTEWDLWLDRDGEGNPRMLEWLAEHDPAKLYTMEARTGRRETPKRVPRRGIEGHVEYPPNVALKEPPKQGSIESFTYPYGCDLKEFVYHLIRMMGPCHNVDVIGEGCGGLCCIVEEDGEEVFVSPESFEIIDIFYELVDEGRVCSPDGDEWLDVPPVPMLDMEPIRTVELFAGIGAFRKAMERQGIPHEVVMSEIDPWATMSYQAIHGPTENLGDISKIEKLPECDLLTYGFPCQDISIAGKQAGFEEGSGTRSSLLWEVRRLLDGMEHPPRVLIMENVKNLVAKKNLPGFQKWIDWLATKGYVSTWAETDPVAFGVPQHRPRIIMVSVLDGPAFDWSGKPIRKTSGKPMLKDTLSWVAERVDTESTSVVRRLTPTECYRLMGFDDRDAYRASRVCSETQLYKQAGNSIVVNVLEWIFLQLIEQGIWTVRSR